jgi:superfamily II DNA/RNA helicase
MKIVDCLPKDRQTIMFSATMPDNIRKLAKRIMSNPAEVRIAISRPPESIAQRALCCYETQKIPFIIERLKEEQLRKVILFVGKKQRVKELTVLLNRQGLDARAMHSDLEQKQRDEVMLDFRNNKVDVLVATDIVARGIDVDDIPLVINYDVPRDAEDYVHRIGRTARAENKGEAITLVSPEDARYWNKIERFLQKDIQRLTLPSSLGDAPDNNLYAPAQGHRRNAGSHKHSRHGRGRGNMPRGRKPGGNPK